MGDSVRTGASRICSYCASPNQGAHRYCVRCSAPLDPASEGRRPVKAAATRPRSSALRYVLAAGVVLALAAGFMIHSLVRATREVPVLTDDVRADNPPAPPPAVSGWVPGGSAPVVAPEAAPALSSGSFPVARPNPYAVPGDPGSSMVGIAPRAPRARVAVARQQAFTNDDLLETRDAGRSAPEPDQAARPSADADERSKEVAKREMKLREKQARLRAAEQRLSAASGDDRDDAADDVEDARHDADKAARKLEEARRSN